MANGIIETMAADIAEIKEMLAEMNGTPTSSKKEEEPKEKGETAAQKKAREKKEAAAAAAPDFTAEELRDKFLEVQGKHGDGPTKELITGLGYDKLAKLIADAANWQKSWDAAEEKLAEDAGDDDNGGL